MNATAFLSLALTCSPQVDAATAQALVAVESGFNPHAIGVVGGVLQRQPRTRAEAMATAQVLHADGWNFSVGLAQINRSNFDRLGLTLERALDPCTNLAAMETILVECFDRAARTHTRSPLAGPFAPQAALRQALSCYYSGNFSTGFRHGYVRRVEVAAQRTLQEAP